jgi:hypothetical protein
MTGEKKAHDEYNKKHSAMDKYVLPHNEWTVEKLIVIMTLVGKAFNCTNYAATITRTSLQAGEITTDVANFLVGAVVPSRPQVLIEKDFKNHPPFVTKVSRTLGNPHIKFDKATKGIESLNDSNETSAGESFHQVTMEGISPIVQNLLLPMGLQKTGENVTCCPFVVGGFNNRDMDGSLMEEMTNTILSKKPRFHFMDQYNTTLVAKTSFDSLIKDPTKLKELLVYDASKEERHLLGSHSGPEDNRIYSGVILPTTEHLMELQSLFSLIGSKRKTKSDGRILDLHKGYSVFKLQLENLFRELVISEQSEGTASSDPTASSNRTVSTNPVDAMRSLATTIMSHSGTLMKGFFPNLSEMDTSISVDCQLPETIRLCKLLLQGQSLLVDQLMEGNHRQSCISSISESIDRSDSTAPLAIHLFFLDSKVIQIIPAQMDQDITPTIEKVCLISIIPI